MSDFRDKVLQRLDESTKITHPLLKATDAMFSEHGFSEHPRYPKSKDHKMYHQPSQDVSKFDALSKKLSTLGWVRDYSYNERTKSDQHHFFDHPEGFDLSLGNKNNGGKHEAHMSLVKNNKE